MNGRWKKMVTVGIVGLGPDWETRYRPVLQKLRGRIAVRALYDPVASRAEQLAAEWNAETVDGLLALAQRTDIRALLLLDAGWHGWESVRLLCGQGKPVFVVSGFRYDQAQLHQLHEQARALGQTVMPAFGLRYTPASCRLRELMATSLGPPRTITVHASLPENGEAADQPDARELFIGLADWCRYIAGVSPKRVLSRPGETPAECETTSVTMELGGPPGKPPAVLGELHLPALKPTSLPPDIASGTVTAAQVQATIVCAQGTATIESPTQIVWENGSDSARETLTSERTETEVMLDLFCRRVVGGLIPVADVSDVVRGAQLLDAFWTSRESGRAVEL